MASRSSSSEGWVPGICSWCENVALVTELVRGDRRDFCTPCLDKLAMVDDGTDYVAQDGQYATYK